MLTRFVAGKEEELLEKGEWIVSVEFDDDFCIPQKPKDLKDSGICASDHPL